MKIAEGRDNFPDPGVDGGRGCHVYRGAVDFGGWVNLLDGFFEVVEVLRGEIADGYGPCSAMSQETGG